MKFMKWKGLCATSWFAAVTFVCAPGFSFGAEGELDTAKKIAFYGYEDCIELSNDRVSVVLCPAAGGRVLQYSIDGKNVLYLPPGDEGWTATKSDQRRSMHAGRFDIGPEKMVNRGLVLWNGKWEGTTTGTHSARLTSQIDDRSGVRLIRDFVLDAASSHLMCTQTIDNVSEASVNLCHWSRTFAIGDGIAVVPRTQTPKSHLRRFPKGYVIYPNGNQINFGHDDPSIRVTDDAVVIKAAPQYPKLGFDSHAGVIAYFAPNDLLFIKRFKTYPKRSYNEVAGLTISIWYPQTPMVELEPIGPAEHLDPGQQASFTEHWYLMPHEFPSSADSIDGATIKTLVDQNTTEPQ